MRAALPVLLLACAPSASAQGIVVHDQRDVRISLPVPPARIVTIPMPAAAMVAGIDGSAERLIGMNPASQAAIRDQIMGTIYPGLKKVPTNIVKGGQFTPNIETLLKLKPDLVFQWAGRGEDVISAIERAGLKAYGLHYRSQEELEGWMLGLGALLSKRDKTDALVAWHRRVRAELEARAVLPGATRPAVLYFGQIESGLRPAGTTSYMDFVMRLAGGRNVAQSLGQVNADVTFEQILAWNPDVLLLGGFDKTWPSQIYADPKWRAIKAVRERRVYKMPLGGYRWDPPSHESPLAWRWLHGLLHPAASPSGLRREMREIYRLVYDYELNDGQIDQILNMDTNAASRNYEQYRGH